MLLKGLPQVLTLTFDCSRVRTQLQFCSTDGQLLRAVESMARACAGIRTCVPDSLGIASRSFAQHVPRCSVSPGELAVNPAGWPLCPQANPTTGLLPARSSRSPLSLFTRMIGCVVMGRMSSSGASCRSSRLPETWKAVAMACLSDFVCVAAAHRW
jgi:hypothetical protein